MPPGHSVLTTARPFWRGSKWNLAPAAFFPHGGREAEGCCRGLTTPAGFQPEGDANQPPSVVSDRLPPHPARSQSCCLLLFWGFVGFAQGVTARSPPASTVMLNMAQLGCHAAGGSHKTHEASPCAPSPFCISSHSFPAFSSLFASQHGFGTSNPSLSSSRWQHPGAAMLLIPSSHPLLSPAMNHRASPRCSQTPLSSRASQGDAGSAASSSLSKPVCPISSHSTNPTDWILTYTLVKLKHK